MEWTLIRHQIMLQPHFHNTELRARGANFSAFRVAHSHCHATLHRLFHKERGVIVVRPDCVTLLGQCSYMELVIRSPEISLSEYEYVYNQPQRIISRLFDCAFIAFTFALYFCSICNSALISLILNNLCKSIILL